MNGSPMNLSHRKERILISFVCALVLFLFLSTFSFAWRALVKYHNNVDSNNVNFSLDLTRIREVALPPDTEESRYRRKNCRLWDCLNLYQCGQNGLNRLTIYVYPIQDYIDSASGKYATTMTREYYQILDAIIHSGYYTSNPNDACLYLPSIDLLNYNFVEPELVSRALASLNYWDDGKNHILFNMLQANSQSLNGSSVVNTDSAIVLSGDFDTWTYRAEFDVSLPVWSPLLQNFDIAKFIEPSKRDYLLVSAQLNILPKHLRILQSMKRDYSSDMLLLEECNDVVRKDTIRCIFESQQKKEYPDVLATGTFCLVGRSLRLGQPDLLEVLSHSCIPVLAIDNFVLPFEDVLDWSLVSVQIKENELHSLMQRLNSISEIKIQELRQNGRRLFQKYFKDISTITMTALKLLENRIFSHEALSVHDWNNFENQHIALNPLFLPVTAPKTQGFTAVILTFDRVESLLILIQKLALVPSLQSIIVIWNNQQKSPPHLSIYPTNFKPLKVIQTRENKLSNRFFPYNEIETEAILTIDDDINMLTADELDFGFEVWREFPDRIVGFPSRTHVWDNTTLSWRYESEWTNQISMVLTGAAFHHKFWSHKYTYAMPGGIKDWVDEHMNCEDIAMNFLVANITNKPPIKVTPRKKFKCPECTNTEMLSASLSHMRERSACIDRFSRIYGHMPLHSVEFRADPVLYKDNFPEKLKRFNDVGSL